MFLPPQFAPIVSTLVQILTVLLPMVLTGAYSMFCWLLAEPIVMPIWNNLVKPVYYGLLNGIQDLGLTCIRKWREFWNSTNSTQTTNKTKRPNYNVKYAAKPFSQRICPLLFRSSRKPTSEISPFSSRATVSSQEQAQQAPRVPALLL